MKKAVVIFLVLSLMLLLVGCKQGQDNGDGNDPSGGNPPPTNNDIRLSLGDAQSVVIAKNGDYEAIMISGDELAAVLTEISDIYYVGGEIILGTDAQAYDFAYVITAGDVVVMVGDGEFLLSGEEGYTLCEVKRGDFSFLDELTFTPAPDLLCDLIGYDENDLKSISVLDVVNEVQVDVSANTHLKELLLTAEYSLEVDEEVTTPSYKLFIGTYVITVNANGTAFFTASDGVCVFTLPDGGLDYLDTLFEGEATSLGGYDAEQEIKVYNNQSRYAKIEEKTEFLTAIGEVELIKLGNAEHYALGTASYTIKIGEDTIGLYGNYVKTADGIYAILVGDFDFLGELAFNFYDSGYLPWI